MAPTLEDRIRVLLSQIQAEGLYSAPRSGGAGRHRPRSPRAADSTSSLLPYHQCNTLPNFASV